MSSRNSLKSGAEPLSDILVHESGRYKRKGFGLIVGMLVTVSYLYLVPVLGKELYAKYATGLGPVFLYIGVSNTLHATFFLVSNLALLLIYYIKHPFFERYKIESEPWPWEKDPKGFK